MVSFMAEYRVVSELPDFISAEEYDEHPRGGLVRIRISVRDGVVEVLGDAMRPELLEPLLEGLGNEDIEQMMCG
jgi:FtsH ternary system-associated peptide